MNSVIDYYDRSDVMKRDYKKELKQLNSYKDGLKTITSNVPLVVIEAFNEKIKDVEKERETEKTPKELFEEDTELYEAVKYIANNCGGDFFCTNDCELGSNDSPARCCKCEDETLNHICPSHYGVYLNERQTYIDFANQLRKPDHTENGKYVLLDTSDVDICKAWNSIEYGGIIKALENEKLRNIVGQKEFVEPLSSLYCAPNKSFYVPSDCMDEKGYPTGRALVGLWVRINTYVKTYCKIALVKDYKEAEGGCTPAYVIEGTKERNVSYIDQDLASQLMEK